MNGWTVGGPVTLSPPDQSLWVLCAGLYLVDHLRLHSGREMILMETVDRRWIPVIPIQGYRLSGRAVTLLRPFFPFLAAITFVWLAHNPFSPGRMRRVTTLVRGHQRSLAPFRALACVNFISLFIVGPVVTSRSGLAYALTLVVPTHLAAIAVLGTSLAVGRRALRIRWPQVVELTFECAVCPGFFVNVCRKVSLARGPVGGDAVAFSVLQGGPAARITLAYGLEGVLNDLADNGELREGDEAAMSAYKAWLSERKDDV